MKKQVKVMDNKLSLNKQKVANLSVQDLNKIHGGNDLIEADRSQNSTRADFTCCMCTTLIAEDQA